ncbi:hypothetical protein [Aeromonas schubertii]
MKNKSELNKAHYEKNKEVLKEKARVRRVKARKKKTFGELVEELSTAAQKAKAQFIIEQTPTELLHDPRTRTAITTGLECLVKEQQLTEAETLQIKKNKRLVQRWHMFLKALEQHLTATIDKRMQASK